MDAMTTAAAGKPPAEGGFTRKASGLVRDFSQLDTWIYNVLAINIVLNVATSYTLIALTYPGASIWLAFVIAGVFCVFEAVVYAMFTTAMPRSGGDYVFQSRVLGGGVASFFVFPGVVIAQVVFMGLAGWLGANLVFGPFLLLLGAQYNAQWMVDAGNWFVGEWGVFCCGVFIASWAALVNIKGLRLYGMLQRYFFWVGLACLAIVVLGMLFASHTDFVNNLNGFIETNYGTSNAYQKTLAAGGTTTSSFDLGNTILAAVIAAFALIYPAWGVMQAGEIKRANSLKSNLRTIVGAEVFSFVAVAIMAALLVSRVGTDFIFASGNLFFEGASNNPLPVPPFFGFFAALMGGSGFMIWVAFILFFTWWIMWIPNVTLGATRVLVAMSFDRILPEGLGRVNKRTHTPVNAVLLFSALCMISVAFYSFSESFVTYTLGILLLGVTAFGVTMVSAVLFPYRKKSMFDSTVVAKYKWGGVPVMAVCAVVFLAFAIFIDVQCLREEALGINGTEGLIFVGGSYVVAAVIYIGSKLYRKYKQGVDLDVVYQELPIE
jgi:basic amino acid/polyamine antiporter, APA family